MNRKSSIFAWSVCGLGALFYCYEYFLRVAPSVMTQELSQSFNISAAALGNLIAFYYYIYTPMQLPAGLLMDRYGPRRLLALAALMCAIGSYFFAGSSLHLAMLGRLMVGFGSAFAFVGTLRLAVSWLPASRLALVAGTVTTLGMLGAMSADIILSHIIQTLNWQNTIYMSAIIGIIIAALIWFMIPNNGPADDSHHDVEGQNKVTFRQLFSDLKELVKKPDLWLIGIVGCLFYMPISVFAELWGIPYLKQSYAMTNAAASFMISMIFFGEMVGGPVIGWFADRINNRTLPILVFSVIASLLFIVLLFVPGLPKAGLYVILFTIGILCTAQNLVFPIACRMSNPRLAGTAMAMTNMLVMLGGLLFQPLIGVFLELISGKNVKGDLSVYTGKDFQHALIILPIVLALAFVIMFFVKENRSSKKDDAAISLQSAAGK